MKKEIKLLFVLFGLLIGVCCNGYANSQLAQNGDSFPKEQCQEVSEKIKLLGDFVISDKACVKHALMQLTNAIDLVAEGAKENIWKETGDTPHRLHQEIIRNIEDVRVEAHKLLEKVDGIEFKSHEDFRSFRREAKVLFDTVISLSKKVVLSKFHNDKAFKHADEAFKGNLSSLRDSIKYFSFSMHGYNFDEDSLNVFQG